MNRARIIFVAAALNIGLLSAAFGQGAPAGAAPASPNAMINPDTSTNPTDSVMERKLQELIQAKNNPHAGESAAQIAKDKEEEFLDADATAKALQLSCYLMDNRLVSAGKENVGGTTVNAKVYEVSCANGMGYFLVSQKPEAPTGFSCFSADGQRAAAAAKGQDFTGVCELAGNKNLMASATKIMTNAGRPCKVTKLHWFGESAVTKSEYTEIACSDGNGYMLATALPGSPMQMSIIGCADAASRGMNCELTKVAALPPSADPVPTLDMLKAALVQHGVACTVSNMRVIGRQNVSKRHVVEFQCPEHPKGLVAFIPLGSNTSPFETLDCPTAATKAKIMCKL